MSGKPPLLSNDPLELLENNEVREIPLLSQISGPLVGGVSGFVAAVMANYGSKRPLLSGIQRYVLLIGGGIALGKWIDDQRTQYFADRDAVFRHYIRLHREDFPPFERQKYKDLLLPWTPIR